MVSAVKTFTTDADYRQTGREVEGDGKGGNDSTLTYDFRLEGRLDFPSFDLEPIDPPEEWVRADVLLALGTAAQSFLWGLGEELGERKIKKSQTSAIARPECHRQGNN